MGVPVARVQGGAACIMTGDELAALTGRAQQTLAAGARARAGGAADLAALAAREAQHEIVALVGRRLVTNWDNLRRFQAGIDATAPTIVVSFLGDTAVGKSTLIAALMGRGEAAPFVQRSAAQSASTTSNVNLYPCRSLSGGVSGTGGRADGLVVNLLDFEGEGGSAAPVMARDGGGSGRFRVGGLPLGPLPPGAAYAESTARRLGVDVDARDVSPTGALRSRGGRAQRL